MIGHFKKSLKYYAFPVLGEYLEPLTMENRTKRRPPARPAPPAPVRLAKRPDDLPLLPVPAICAVPIDMSVML